MKAAIYEAYGPPEVVQLKDIPEPSPGDDEVLIEVHAAPVTTADWRLRASAFPGAMWVPGRLMTGLIRPRQKVLGSFAAGTVEDCGSAVSDLQKGDRVLAHLGIGCGHAEFAVAKASGTIVKIPEKLSFAEAAAIGFGGVTSLVFLRDFAKLREGQSVLVTGGSGEVGIYAIQIAKALGAKVTAIASGPNKSLILDHGADEFVDYTSEDVASSNRQFDSILDCYGQLNFQQARRILNKTGLFLPLNFKVGEALWNLATGWRQSQKMITNVSGDKLEDLQELIRLFETDKFKPVLDKTYPLNEIQNAHRHLEGRHKKGSVVLVMKP